MIASRRRERGLGGRLPARKFASADLPILQPTKVELVIKRAQPGRVPPRTGNSQQAARLNRITVMNADELILSVRTSKPVRRLVRNHRLSRCKTFTNKYVFYGGEK